MIKYHLNSLFSLLPINTYSSEHSEISSILYFCPWSLQTLVIQIRIIYLLSPSILLSIHIKFMSVAVPGTWGWQGWCPMPTSPPITLLLWSIFGKWVTYQNVAFHKQFHNYSLLRQKETSPHIEFSKMNFQIGKSQQLPMQTSTYSISFDRAHFIVYNTIENTSIALQDTGIIARLGNIRTAK